MRYCTYTNDQPGSRRSLNMENVSADDAGLQLLYANFEDIGDRILNSQTKHVTTDYQNEIDQAVEAAKKMAAQETRVALRKLREDLELDKKLALQTQKDYFEKRNKRVSEQRDRAEEERIRALTKKLVGEKELALERQMSQCEELKLAAVREACRELRARMFDECADEQRKAVQRAVADEQEKARLHELAALEERKRQCEQTAAKARHKLQEHHNGEIHRLTQAYKSLETKYDNAFEHCRRLEKDFKDLQEDYRRFMDYTDGKFHSDYLMDLRRHGMVLATQEIPIYKSPD